MIIKLSPFRPVRPDVHLSLVKTGDTLAINDVSLDFSRLPEGGTLPAEAVGCDFVIEPVERINGDLVLTLMLPYGTDAPEAAHYPVDLYPLDGPVRLPGLELLEAPRVTAGVIDWSQLITPEAKAEAAAERLLVAVVADLGQRRAIADAAIAPLQDAVELGRADKAKQDLLKAWKNYRLDLVEVPEQADYPANIAWPSSPV